jgi:ABC-2 type transport system ATP-binding protein
MSDTSKNLVVEAVGLTKIFKDFWKRPKAVAVSGVDFEIEQGQILGFLGPNGSGKSTTVKMMLGLLNPTSGSLKVFGRAPHHVQTKMRIGYLPEETYLYKYLTARETLDFYGSLFNLGAEERVRRTNQLLEMVGLANSADRQVGEFSKGMARRVGLAQALINDPDLVILDEPTSGLDPIGCREVKTLINELAARKKTVILCSHLLADVEDVCDTVVVMYGGKVRARGKLNELLQVEDKTRIVAPTLSPEVIERVMAILNEEAGDGTFRVDHPTMNLEEFFMDVVRKARDEGRDTSGADLGGEVATYLSSANEGKGEQLLSDLSAAEQDRKSDVAAAETAEEEAVEAETTDESKLTALTDEEPATEAPAAEEPNAELSAEEKEAANKRLEGLLGGD